MSRTRREKKKAARSVRQVRRPAADVFGIERETLIAKSHVRQIFTPHQPISETDLLFGRQTEMRKMMETLNTPGQHALLFGERGVGKSSLATVVAGAVRVATGRKLFVKRCDTQDTFVSIMQAPLRAVGADLNLVQVQRGSSFGVKAQVDIAGLNVGSDGARQVLATYQSSGKLSPSTVAEAIGSLHGLLLVDEADAITRSDDRRRLAELIKMLSDAGSDFKVLVVGIANTAEELTAAHPSVQRCLKETKLRRMSDEELEEIVTSGAKALKLDFAPEVVRAIVKLSAGYPHFTHLLALECAEDAIVGQRGSVAMVDLEAALSEAVEDAEGTLRRIYEDSVRSNSTAYRDILAAAAYLGSGEFSASDLREAYERETGESISQGSLNNYLSQRLISRDGTRILRRTGQGHYRFEDPRMASFVRIVNRLFDFPRGGAVVTLRLVVLG